MPKEKNGAKKRVPRKQKQKAVKDTTDIIENKDEEESSKQKRKGWWSLKG